ncbi:prolyl oligopeptidase family serine peptidase [Siminovitchia sp. FSL H7-0308]|uniref:Dipeptidyl aminopeptidase/acylaminoacyl peptidase n=1 Tax=Siminovitchia thermophila TaxID=1245522 RepID=A0ABS2R8A0_9BACI|nr:prolyl oligopeptidase family serine peptidase [Siminovitchia thermophila]MBM7715867.1 dipeptidyl aminopeptidase/acylaminoacyl peptidase [Siminovitchia thermophila]ONK23965.1 alpha/beta hydrolase [Bacillus sp. VT-16-64]
MNETSIIEKWLFPSPNPNVRMYLMTYMSAGLCVKGLLAEPTEAGMYDGLLYLRGGIKNVGMVRPARIGQFASEGFVVFAPFYRGNRGGEGNEDFAGEDRKDAFSALAVLKSHPAVLEDRIHIFGFSRGGVMALLTAIKHKTAASLVTWGGVADMALTYVERKDLRRMMKRVIGGSPKTALQAYTYRTPLYELEHLRCPVLIVHGERDEHVSIEHAYRLEKRLLELGKKVETRYFKHVTHYFPPSLNREVVSEIGKWMKGRV